MPPNFDAGTSAIAHHIVDGAVTFAYAIDAHHAVSRFPREWSFTPWRAVDVDMTPLVVIVGADKGGVGKTTVSRTLMDYFKARSADYRAFDTEAPAGVLKRFHPDKTTVVDLTRSDDQMSVFDTLKDAQITLVDVRAGLLSPTLKTLAEIGFLDPAKCKIIVLHILGSTQASFDEIKATAELVEGSKHYLVVNRANDASFMGLSADMKKAGDGVIDIPKLNELAAEYVDTAGVSFDRFISDESQSAVMRGYVKSWLGRVFAQFDAAKLKWE
jgi:hypothetical protein